jgi:histidyl-tRNA synthetase
LCASLRKQGIAAEIFPDLTKKIAKQLDYANKLQISHVCIVGSEEMQTQKYKLKNLSNGQQLELSAQELIQHL